MTFINLTFFLLMVSLAKGFPQPEATVTSTSPRTNEYNDGSSNPKTLINKDEIPSPFQSGYEEGDNNGFTEVKESEIPEGSLVYVLEEPIDTPTDGESMQTANNIVFRPLFRYRGKQEAQRRNYNRIRRRYFIPRRQYRQTYSHYPCRYY